MSFTEDEITELKELYRLYCDDSLEDITVVLEKCGFNLPTWKIRKIKEEIGSGEITEGTFIELCRKLIHVNPSSYCKTQVNGVHPNKISEEIAFVEFINVKLKNDPDLTKHLPIQEDELYEKTTDGIIFCKLVNLSSPNTIDERVIIKEKLSQFNKLENITLAVNSAGAIGCSVRNLSPANLLKGSSCLTLELLWQIIRVGLFNPITLENHPGFADITDIGEHLNDLTRLSPRKILLKWVNYQLKKAGIEERIGNFSSDIDNSIIYIHLLHQVAPKSKRVTTQALVESDLIKRAALMLEEARKLGCALFIKPDDVVAGVAKLNLAFVANLFKNYSALEPSTYFGRPETREERIYLNWINSIGVKPYVKDLYSDLINGLVLLQIFDHIQPGIVNWKLVYSNFDDSYEKTMQMLENCKYCVRLGKEMGFCLVGICAWDLSTGRLSTLSFLWQLMRAYTMALLRKLSADNAGISVENIVMWVNCALTHKCTGRKIKSFCERDVSYARVILDVIEDFNPQNVELGDEEDDLSVAKYAISIARKVGAKVFAFPEDLVEGHGNMIMTIFACLMAIEA